MGAQSETGLFLDSILYTTSHKFWQHWTTMPRMPKQKREEKAASSGETDKDSDPEDGAKARGPLHYGRIAPRVEDFLPHATWDHRDLRMCVFVELESLAERSEMVTTGLPLIFP